jgi:NAD(P)H-hydrate epimerase
METKRAKIQFIEVTQEFDPPHLERGMLVVDGLFGS